MKEPENKEKQPQATPSAPRRRKPPPKPPSWDQEKAVALAKKGVGPADIGLVVGAHRTTVSDYLRRALPEFEALKAFRESLGDSLSLSLAHLINLEDKLLTLLDDEDMLSTLTPTEKASLLGRISVAKGIAYDKLRLQTDKSGQKFSHEIQVNIVHKQLDYYSTPEHLRVEAKADGDGESAGMG